MNVFFIVASFILALLAAAIWQRQLTLRREAFIRSFALPQGL